MGQQQLLLLVLSTVIVGLATVAGIQAFSENQTQATQDALVQRAINIGNDVMAAHNEPSQFGGIDLSSDSDNGQVARAAGYETSDGTGISADGAGDSAACEVVANGDGTATINCDSDGDYSDSDSDQHVEVTVDPSLDNPVSTTTINGNSA